tara:strand:- start:100 stop:252 length:153 start_codon:yes stop_codon:yes gene_type:complete
LLQLVKLLLEQSLKDLMPNILKLFQEKFLYHQPLHHLENIFQNWLGFYYF